MMMKNRVKWILLIVIVMNLFCGCNRVENNPENSFYDRAAANEQEVGKEYSSKVDQIYNDAYERFTEPGYAKEMEGADIFEKVSRYMLSGYHRTYRVLRTQSPNIIICSLGIGITMMTLAEKNKKVQRTGLVVFIIGIPAIIIVAVFGIGILNGVLLY